MRRRSFFLYSPLPSSTGKASSGGLTGQDRTAIHGKGSSGGLTRQDRTAIHGKGVPVDKPGLHQGDSALGLPPHLPNRRTIRKFAGRNIR